MQQRHSLRVLALLGTLGAACRPPAPPAPPPPSEPLVVKGELKPTTLRGLRVAPAKLPLLASDAVLVLSPVSVEQVSSSLTAETTARTATAGPTRDGVAQTADYNAAVSMVESRLLALGLQPVSQAMIAATADRKGKDLATRV